LRFIFSILLSVFLLQCKEETKISDAQEIIKEYIENPIFGKSNTVYLNSEYFFPKATQESFSVQSYFDKRTIKFRKSSQLEVQDFDSIKFVPTHFSEIKKLNLEEYFIISKPILSENQKYAILETGIFHYKEKGSQLIGTSDLPNLIHVFLYKKENGKWKRLELITQIRL
jgi:hypothetical protein